MPQSLAKICVHSVFSSKNRERIINDKERPALHAYMGGILRDLESPSLEINTEPDHAHVLFFLSRKRALSEVIGHLKRGSSAWLRSQAPLYLNFHWQNGFGAFSVTPSHIEEVRRYIRDQCEHHRTWTFQEELRVLLEAHQMDWDERYVWD